MDRLRIQPSASNQTGSTVLVEMARQPIFLATTATTATTAPVTVTMMPIATIATTNRADNFEPASVDRSITIEVYILLLYYDSVKQHTRRLGSAVSFLYWSQGGAKDTGRISFGV